MRKKSGLESAMETTRPIKAGAKLPKAFKGKALRGTKSHTSPARPAGGGKKGY